MSETEWHSAVQHPSHEKPVLTWHPDHGYSVMIFVMDSQRPFGKNHWVVAGNIDGGWRSPVADPKEWRKLPAEPR